jgi:predicted nuclease with RNAse H fold
MNEILVIGLDAASERKNFGYAVGYLLEGCVRIEQAGCLASRSHRRDDTVASLAQLLRSLPSDTQALIAVDAPLGWPTALSQNLGTHRAGEKLEASKNALFRRTTDTRLRERGHQPLEIGADRIARAAVEALAVLSELRDQSELALPLAWNPQFAGAAVIEVYPAATLRAHGLPNRSYKKIEQLNVRQEVALALDKQLLGIGKYIEAEIDAFDACLCLLSARDFIAGRCEPPIILSEAEREGWIWVHT